MTDKQQYEIGTEKRRIYDKGYLDGYHACIDAYKRSKKMESDVNWSWIILFFIAFFEFVLILFLL